MPSNIFASASTSSLNLPAFGAAFPPAPPAPAETTAAPTDLKTNTTKTTIYSNPLANTSTASRKLRIKSSCARSRAHRLSLTKEYQFMVFCGANGCLDWTSLPVFVPGNEFVREEWQRQWEVDFAGTLAANGDVIRPKEEACPAEEAATAGAEAVTPPTAPDATEAAEPVALPRARETTAAAEPMAPSTARITTAWTGWGNTAQTAVDNGETMLFDFEGGGTWGRMPDIEPLFAAPAQTPIPKPAQQPIEEVKRRSDAKRPGRTPSPDGQQSKRARVPIWSIQSETDLLDFGSSTRGNERAGASLRARTPMVERWGECRGETMFDKFGVPYYQVTQAEDVYLFSEEDEEDALCMKMSCPIRAQEIAFAIDDADFDPENDPEEEVNQPANDGRGLVGRILEKAKPWFKRGGWMEKIILKENAEEMGRNCIEDEGRLCETHEVCVAEAEEARRPLAVLTPKPKVNKVAVVGVPKQAEVAPTATSKARKPLMGLTPLTASKPIDTTMETTSKPIEIPTVARPRPAEVQYESVAGPWRQQEPVGWMDAMMTGAWTC